jgi:hypothetical protein
MKYKLTETTKLYYNKYTCKVVLHNSLAGLFRSKNYTFVKKNLDILQKDAEAGLPLYHPVRVYSPSVSIEDFQDACIIYDHIKRDTHDYLIRVDGYDLTIYANDEEWLEKLISQIVIKEYHKPRDAEHKTFLLNNKNLVIHHTPVSYEYQIYLPDTAPVSFANFIKANIDKIRIGNICLDAIEHGQFLGGLYFWARDVKVLHLAGIACGNKFRKVIRHIYEPEN